MRNLVKILEEVKDLPGLKDFEFLLKVMRLLVLKNQMQDKIQILLERTNVAALHMLQHAIHNVQVGDLGR